MSINTALRYWLDQALNHGPLNSEDYKSAKKALMVATPEQPDDCREAFERWCGNQASRCDDGTYYCSIKTQMWDSWRASWNSRPLRESGSQWQPIEAAPYGRRVLVWWVPVGDNPWAECVSVAQRCYVETPHADEGQGAYDWWSNGRYYPASHITAWMEQPLAPADRNLEARKLTNPTSIEGQ